MSRRKGSSPRHTQSHLKCGPPPHMTDENWLDFEYRVVKAILPDLKDALADLEDEITVKTVHEARVIIRRWSSIWAVLTKDGWESKKFQKTTGKKLKKLAKRLGHLRDWDVNIGMAEEFKCSKRVLDNWQSEQEHEVSLVKDYLSGIDLGQLLKDLKRYLRQRHKKLSNKMDKRRLQSAYIHLQSYLQEQENRVKAKEAIAAGFEELHALRLEIKRWRYLLVEFFGLTNLQLTRAQQILGKVHDYNRMAELLTDMDDAKALGKVETATVDMLKQAEQVRSELIYDLRPFVSNPSSLLS